MIYIYIYIYYTYTCFTGTVSGQRKNVFIDKNNFESFDFVLLYTKNTICHSDFQYMSITFSLHCKGLVINYQGGGGLK